MMPTKILNTIIYPNIKLLVHNSYCEMTILPLIAVGASVVRTLAIATSRALSKQCII